MNRPVAEDELAEKPLDPAMERVRAKLVRFAILNIGILFLALVAVVAAIAWKSIGRAPAQGTVDAALELPAGGRVVSQALSGGELSLLAAWPDGAQAVFIYDRRDGRLVGRYRIDPK